MTAQEMCEYAAKYLREVRGIEVEPRAIFEADANGGLWTMFALYWEAWAYDNNKQYMGIAPDGTILWADKETA